MKLCVVSLLIVLSSIHITTANWKNDVKINHWQHINSIINDTLSRIRREADAKGTAGAQSCAENARSELRDISRTGYSEVENCVRRANNAGDANVCSQQADSRVFESSLQVSKDASSCITRA